MTAADEHLAQARANLRLFRHLSTSDLGPIGTQWAVTVAFYTALHCVEAEIRRAGLPGSSHHKQRAQLLSEAGVPGTVIDAYKQLQQWSHQARYVMASFDQVFVDDLVQPELRIVLEFAGLSLDDAK